MENPANCSNNISSRRSFLKRIATLGTGAFAFPYVVNASALGKGAAPAASERITIAAIGVGSKGYRDTRSLVGDRRVQYVAVCDVDRSCRKKTQKLVNTSYRKGILSRGCKDYADFREIIARKDIDAVNIATPDHWHAIIAIQAVKAGKDVYCQKPLALTLEQGRKMANAVKRHGVVFQTGTQRRSDERFRRACELVRNRRLGKIRSVEVELPGGKSIDGFYTDPVPRGFDYDMWLGPAPKAEFSYKRIDRMGWRFISDYAGAGKKERRKIKQPEHARNMATQYQSNQHTSDLFSHIKSLKTNVKSNTLPSSLFTQSTMHVNNSHCHTRMLSWTYPQVYLHYLDQCRVPMILSGKPMVLRDADRENLSEVFPR